MHPPPAPIGTPAAELEITLDLVQRLLSEQHPDLADLPLASVAAGWDNVMYRLGEHLAVRLPRRQLGANLIEREQTWLPQLADRLPLPVPTPLRVGYPSADYPWRWSIVPWIPGVPADLAAPENVSTLTAFLQALHQPAPADAPINLYRGVPLQQRAAMVTERMQRLATQTHLITPKLEQLWAEALSAPIDISPTWLHGDLHPRNILVHEGEISGIIDWGDMTVGDAATDLAAVWMLFDDAHLRQRIWIDYGVSRATWQRAQGWAIMFGVVLLDTGLVDNPRFAMIGEQILHRLLE
jgi:aminoglycoside phosphotransferase (APT) family kinase protein